MIDETRHRAPEAREYEKAALYLALQFTQAASTVFETLDESDFSDARLREIWKCGRQVYLTGHRVTFLSTAQELDESGYTLPQPLVEFLAFRPKEEPRSSDLSNIVAKIGRLSALRGLEQLGTTLLRDVRNANGSSVEELLESTADKAFSVESRLFDLVEEHSDRRLYSGKSYRKRRAAGLDRKFSTPKIGTGLKELDKYLSYGFAPGKQTILAGRPGIGKSAVKTNFMKSLCERKFSVLSISPEMGIDDDGDRLDSLVANIPLKDLSGYRHWAASDPRHSELKKAIRIQSKWKLYTYAHRRVSVSTVANQLNKLRRRGIHVDVVFIDLFDRLADVQVTKNKNYQIGTVLNELASLAQEYQTHFVHLVQIHRLGRQSSAQRYKPTMEDLKGSGSFEEFADQVLLLWREGYYNKGVVDDRLEICLAKQRGGIGGDHMWLKFLLQKECMFIGSLMEEEGNRDEGNEDSDVEPVEDEGEIW